MRSSMATLGKARSAPPMPMLAALKSIGRGEEVGGQSHRLQPLQSLKQSAAYKVRCLHVVCVCLIHSVRMRV